MANPREVLARLSIHGIPHGHHVAFGGTPELRPHDVAAAMGLANLDPTATALLLFKFTGDETSWWYLWRHWYLTTVDMGLRLPHKEDRIPMMVVAMASLVEHIEPMKCRACKGTKDVVINDKVVVCDKCGGSGVRYYTMAKLAHVANVPYTSWRRHYADFYEQCKAELQSVEDAAIRRLAVRLVRAA